MLSESFYPNTPMPTFEIEGKFKQVQTCIGSGGFTVSVDAPTLFDAFVSITQDMEGAELNEHSLDVDETQSPEIVSLDSSIIRGLEDEVSNEFSAKEFFAKFNRGKAIDGSLGITLADVAASIHLDTPPPHAYWLTKPVAETLWGMACTAILYVDSYAFRTKFEMLRDFVNLDIEDLDISLGRE